MKLGTIDEMFYKNYKRRLMEEELNSFGGIESDKPIDVIRILDEYFEQTENDDD